MSDAGKRGPQAELLRIPGEYADYKRRYDSVDHLAPESAAKKTRNRFIRFVPERKERFGKQTEFAAAGHEIRPKERPQRVW